MNELINALIRASVQGAEEGGRLRAMVQGVAEHCAQIAEKEGAQAPELIRQAFVYPTPTQTALAVRRVTAS